MRKSTIMKNLITLCLGLVLLSDIGQLHAHRYYTRSKDTVDSTQAPLASTRRRRPSEASRAVLSRGIQDPRSGFADTAAIMLEVAQQTGATDYLAAKAAEALDRIAEQNPESCVARFWRSCRNAARRAAYAVAPPTLWQRVVGCCVRTREIVIDPVVEHKEAALAIALMVVVSAWASDASGLADDIVRIVPLGALGTLFRDSVSAAALPLNVLISSTTHLAVSTAHSLGLDQMEVTLQLRELLFAFAS